MRISTTKHSAFTLLELIVVIIILSVLAGIVIPNLSQYTEEATAAEGIKILTVLREAQLRYKLEFDSYTNNIDVLDVDIDFPSHFEDPTLSTSNPIASVKRKTRYTYTLAITDAGVISCTGDTTGCGVIEDIL